MGQEKTRKSSNFFFPFFLKQISSRGSRYFCARQTNAKNVERPVRTLPPNVQDSKLVDIASKKFFYPSGIPGFSDAVTSLAKAFQNRRKERNARSVMKNNEHRLEISTMDWVYFSSYISFHNFVSFSTIEFTHLLLYCIVTRMNETQ